MKKAGLTLSALLVCSGPAISSSVDFKLGEVPATADMEKVVLHTRPPLTIDILPGGKMWPPLSVGNDGAIYAGGVVISSATGKVVSTAKQGSYVLPHGVQIQPVKDRFRFSLRNVHCELSSHQLRLSKGKPALAAMKAQTVVFATSKDQLLALVRSANAGDGYSYKIQQIDLANCKVKETVDLGKPDLLVELNSSEDGGWWITGSIEQTLLRSADGKIWHDVALPESLSVLISSYVVNDKEIWLAASLHGKSPYMLVYTGDGGMTWVEVVRDDPVLQKMPVGWLEGQIRRSSDTPDEP